MHKQHKTVIKENRDDLAFAGAHLFMNTAKDCVSKYDSFTVAISGGSTPRAMHCLLSKEPFLSGILWSKTHIFWVDDRCVPYNNPASNYGAAKSDLLDMVPIPENQVHPIPVDISPQKAALKYQKDILEYFNPAIGEKPSFDLIILGIGTDGHTASLFPEARELEEKERLILSVQGGNPFVHRLTMTLPILNRAKETLFLASGAEKAAIVKKIFNNGDSRLPARLIKPLKGNLTWLMDKEAGCWIPDT